MKRTTALLALVACLTTQCSQKQNEEVASSPEQTAEITEAEKLDDYRLIPSKVYFNKPIREWDGFGVNYVETSQTFDYDKYPQDYGGFRFLNESAKDSIIRLTFGDNGLMPGLVKMFLDPLHQEEEGGAFDHEKTTGSMRHFVKEGLKLTRARGDELEIVTTLYGPPAYITKQKVMRGRDLDPEQQKNLANYMIDWADCLKAHDFPIKYISLHNEGESWRRWPNSGKIEEIMEDGHDYNFFS